MQGIRAASERQNVSRINARFEQPRPTAVAHEQARQRWYTPAQNFDDIRSASTDSSSHAGLRSDSEDEATVLRDLERRSRERREKEAARASEARRSEREKAEVVAEREAREREHRRAARQPSDARASTSSYAVGNKNDSGRAQQSDESKGRRSRGMMRRDFSESSVESDFSGRRRRAVKTAGKDRSDVRRTSRASSVSSFASESDSGRIRGNTRKTDESKSKTRREESFACFEC